MLHVVCKDDSESCYYGDYSHIGVGEDKLILYMHGKDKVDYPCKVIKYDQIIKLDFTPVHNEIPFTSYDNYDLLLKYDNFKKETVSKSRKQLDIFSFLD